MHKKEYSNLAGGSYTFRVRAKNLYGEISEEGQYSFRVQDPWYLRWWAWVLYVAILGLLFWMGVRYYTKRLEQRNEYLEGLVKQRTVEIEQQKEEILVQADNLKEINEELEQQQHSILQKNTALETAYKSVQVLSTMGQEISAKLDLEEIFSLVYEDVNKLMDASIFGIGLYRPEVSQIEYRMAIANGKRYQPYSRDTTDKNQFAVWCIENKELVFINNVKQEYSQYISEYDISTEEDDKLLEDGTRSQTPISLVYLPLIVQEELLGIITVQSFEKGAYTKQHLDILQNLAIYTSNAIKNAASYEKIEQQRKQVEKAYKNVQLLSEIGRNITAELTFKKVMNTVYTSVNDIMDANIFAIGLVNHEQQQIDMYGIEKEGGSLEMSSDPLTMTDSLAVWCYKNSQQVFINSFEDEYQQYLPKVSFPPTAQPRASLIYLPLKGKKGTIGVLTVQSFKKDAYTAYHLSMLQNIAIYSSIALSNAQTHEQITQAYRTVKQLSEMGQSITAKLSVEDIIQGVYKEISELMPADGFGIGIYEPATDSHVERIKFPSFIENDEPLPLHYDDLGDDDSLSDWCFKNQKGILINDFEAEVRMYMPEWNHQPAKIGLRTHSLIYLPLTYKNKAVGNITVQSFQKNAYNEHHLDIMSNLAIYTAIALANADAYKQIEEQKVEIEKEKEESESLLLNILPEATAQELKKYGKATPKRYQQVSVLFADFKGFTQIAETLPAEVLVAELDAIFGAFDDICEQFQVEKIKTIGDAYMCAAGIPIADTDNALRIVKAGQAMQAFIQQKNAQQVEGLPEWRLRVGVHTGSITAGVVGKKKFAYDIWGDAVNLAARMESAGEESKVNISGDTYKALHTIDPQLPWEFTYRGKIEAKNKGKVDMYFVEQ